MENLQFEKMNKYIGVELQDFSDITLLQATTVTAIKQLVSTYGMVVIKGKRRWTEEEQIAFTSGFGEIELPAIYSVPPAQTEHRKSNMKITKGSGVFWHSDNSYRERPSHLSTFQMVEIPKSGTATSFASLLNLSANLPAKDKLLWRDYAVVYRGRVLHPLLWKHPFNGKDTVYFDIGFSTDIINHCKNGSVLPVKESNQIFNYINERLSDEESLIKHQWEEGDVIVLDNYAVAHRADILMEDENRTLLRMTTEGIYF